jgi:hypothetical protein
MRTNTVRWLCFIGCCLVFVVPLFAQQSADRLSGTWTGDWGTSPTHRNIVTVEFKWDGKALKGTVNPGPGSIALQKATFDANNGAIHMEANARGERGQVHFVIDGKVVNGTMTGSWNHDDQKGDFKITKK